MQILRDFRANLIARIWPFPMVLLGVMVLSYGLLLPETGFYWDDWETALVQQQFGTMEYWNYFDRDRPFAAWTYMIFAPLAGVHPFRWQLVTFILRCLTAIGMWKVLCNLWPGHKRIAGFAALLFAVYPVFLQQHISMSYHQHWTQYLLFFGSIELMILSVRPGRYQKWLTIPALGAFFLNAAVTEYFIGLELLRPIILWIILHPAEQDINRRHVLRRVALTWLPYLLALMIFLVWRFRPSAAGIDPINTPTLFLEIIRSPVAGSLRLVQMVIQDLVFMLGGSWYKLLDPKLVTVTQPVILISWGIAFLVALFVTSYTLRVDRETKSISQPPPLKWIALFGAASILLGGSTIWATSRQVSNVQQYSDRFGLAMMFGASLLIAVILDWMIRAGWRKAILLGILVGLSAGLHIRTSNDYRWSWIRQNRIYWQLYWRAPFVELGTTFFSENDLVSFVRPTYAFNLLYNQPQGTRQLAYAFYLNRDYPDLSRNTSINMAYRNFTFTGTGNRVLLIHYDPPRTGCLWVLSPSDNDDPLLPASVRRILPLANLQTIDPAARGIRPPEDIFGVEPERDWCYYYQKAELSRQLGSWSQVAELGRQAISNGYSPNQGSSNTPHEWLTFIEGFARLAEWETARDLTLDTYEREPLYREKLCAMWGDFELRQKSGSDGENNRILIREKLNCSGK